MASIDREEIIKEAYVGNATLAKFPINTTSIYYDGEVKGIAYNRENAEVYLKKSLAKLSQTIKIGEDSDSVFDISSQSIIDDNDVNGSANVQISKSEINAMLSELSLKIIVSKNNEARIKVASMIKEDLGILGVNCEIEELDSSEMTKALNSKDYDLALIGYNLSSWQDARNILESLDLKDSKVNELIKSLGNSKSEETTKEIYSELQQRVASRVSFISLGILDNYVVSSNRLKGDIYPNDFDIYNGISSLQVD